MSNLIERFWMWLYKRARSHLPPDYYDHLLQAYLLEKMEELRGSLGDNFVLWFVNEMGAATPETLPRERRDEERDFHYPR